jgi:hypothetical protein
MRRPTTPSTGRRWSQRQCQGSRPKTAGRKDEREKGADPAQPGRTAGTGVHPGPAEAAEPEGQEEGGDAEGLEQQVAEPGAEEADPVADGVGAGLPVAVLSEGSAACQVASERRRRSETSSSMSPRKTFRGRLRVGTERCEWASWLDAPAPWLAQGVCRERAKRADEESQSSFYYPWAGGGFWGKRGGGNPAGSCSVFHWISVAISVHQAL